MINNSAATALLSFVLLNLIFGPNFKKNNFNIIAYLKPKIHICRHLINFVWREKEWDL